MWRGRAGAGDNLSGADKGCSKAAISSVGERGDSGSDKRGVMCDVVGERISGRSVLPGRCSFGGAGYDRV